MTQGEQAVQAAFKYAAISGSGFWLRLHLADGKLLRGPCHTPDNGIMRMDVFSEEDGGDHAEPVWVNLSMVTHVQIEW